MNILFSDPYLYGFNKNLADITRVYGQIGSPNFADTILDVLVTEVAVRVLACAAAIFSSAVVVFLVPLDLFYLNISLIDERSFEFAVVLRVNFLFLKIVMNSLCTFICATVAPKYVYSELKLQNCLRRDFGRLFAEIPLDLQTLIRKVKILHLVENIDSDIFQNWRERLAMHLAENLLDTSDLDVPVIVDFNFSFYGSSLVQVIEEIQAEIRTQQEREADPEKVSNWKNSKIEENIDYKALIRLYLSENKIVPLSNSIAALKQLENAFTVQGKEAVRKKMRKLYLLLHPDKTSNFILSKQSELQKLYTFANAYTKLAMG